MPNRSGVILIGEDDIDDQELLKETFSAIDSSFVILFAGRGEDILSRIQQSADEELPRLILLDYNMPGLTGVEGLKELKNDTRCRRIPKIIWSTSDWPEYRSTCLEMGAKDFLVKPSNVKDLVNMCRYMLSCVSPK